MISFRNDYSEGAHPSVLEALSRSNFETTCGYSMDPFCRHAADTVRELTDCPDADVHFIVGKYHRYLRRASPVGGRDCRNDGAHQRSRDRRD